MPLAVILSNAAIKRGEKADFATEDWPELTIPLMRCGTGNNADNCLKYESLRVALLRKKRESKDMVILPSTFSTNYSQTEKDAIFVKQPQQVGNGISAQY